MWHILIVKYFYEPEHWHFNFNQLAWMQRRTSQNVCALVRILVHFEHCFGREIAVWTEVDWDQPPLFGVRKTYPTAVTKFPSVFNTRLKHVFVCRLLSNAYVFQSFVKNWKFLFEKFFASYRIANPSIKSFDHFVECFGWVPLCLKNYWAREESKRRLKRGTDLQLIFAGETGFRYGRS